MRTGPVISAGLGIRSELFDVVIDQRPPIDFLEAHSENYFGDSIARAKLLELGRHYPLSLHGVGLSLGRADSLDQNHLVDLQQLVDEVDPLFVSEHLAWSAYQHRHLPDLLPLPLTAKALSVMCAHIEQMQDALQRRILIENPSNYLVFDQLQIPEPEFLNVLADRTGCGLLVDINNIYVSATNLGRDAEQYISKLNSDAICQYHLAGYTEVERAGEQLLIDSHNHTVYPAVWELFAETLARHGARPTLIEWDSDFPEFPVLLGECFKADQLLQSAPSVAARPRALVANPPDAEPDQNLAGVQQDFLDRVLKHSKTLPQAIASHRHRLWIYQNNVTAAIREYLEQVYPALMGVVGSAFFKQMALSFMQSEPPVQGNIHEYGVGFSKVLQRFDTLSDLPYLADLIDYEWALHRAYFSSLADCIDSTDIDQQELLNMSVTFNGSIHLLSSSYPIFEIHRQSLPEYQGPVEIDIGQSQDSLLVYKCGDGVVTRVLSNDESLFLNALADAENLLQAIERLQGSIPVQSLTSAVALVFELRLLSLPITDDVPRHAGLTMIPG